MTTLLLIQSSANGAAALLVQVMPILAIGLVFYFLVIAMLSSLKKGDRVMTSGGIYGTIQGVEAEVVYLKIADNVKVKVSRSAVSGVVTGETE